MGADTSQGRNADAIAMFNYGFNISRLYVDETCDDLPKVPVKNGVMEEVGLKCEYPFRYLDVEGRDLTQITKEVRIQEESRAPIENGQIAGEVVYSLNGEWIGSVPVLYEEAVPGANYFHSLKKLMSAYLL